MAHTVWNLGSLVASARVQPRQFIAGIEPARGVMIGRSREPKKMIVLQDAWIEVNAFTGSVSSVGMNQGKYSLALGKDPLNTARLIPVGRIGLQTMDVGVGNTDQPATGAPPNVEQLFKAHGTMWATKYIAVDFQESGALTACDVDLHLDWGVAFVDWWTWFVSWNQLEASPDGSLVDGERAYA